MRKHAACKKPSDAVHLASALLMNVDEMHTYDGSDLLILNEKGPIYVCDPLTWGHINA